MFVVLPRQCLHGLRRQAREATDVVAYLVAQRPSDYVIAIRVLNGVIHRSACASRSGIDSPSKRSSGLSTTARYTRRPEKRTDGDVVRASHRPHVKLNRREYSSRTALGQPRGLRG